MVKMKERGFTLIELLVVIAIIGLLAAVVLASLGTARQKGADAAVKSDLDSMRAQAELVASNSSNSYSGVCSDTTVLAQMKNAGNSTGSSVGTANAAGTYNTVACDSASGSWVVQAPLSGSVSTAPSFWCVDGSGAAIADTTVAPAAATACPTP